jgi:hypothetical protein
VVNLALWRVKRRGPPPPGTFVIPLWVPVAGFLASVGIVALRLTSLIFA